MWARWKSTAGAVALAVLVASVAWQQWGPRRAVSPGLRAELATRVTDFLEHDPRWRLQAAYGAWSRPYCESSVFGADPIDVSDVDQVRTVYAWVDCRWLPPAGRRLGVSLRELPAEVHPMAVNLAPPAGYELAGDLRERFPRSLEQIFPGKLRDQAKHRPRAAEAATARLEQRIDVLLEQG